MKKRMGIGLLVLSLLFAAAGCGKSADEETETAKDISGAANITDSAAPTDAAQNPENAADDPTDGGEWNGKAFDKDIISDMYALDGVLEVVFDDDEESDALEYSIHIPQICEDTEGAQEINALIRECYGSIAQDIIATGGKVEGYENVPVWFDISYETYWNSSIVSIVIISRDWLVGDGAYDVCNYDAAIGERVTNEQLLSMHLIAESDFETLARITAVKESDRLFEEALAYMEAGASADDEYMADFYAMYVQCRLATMCNESIDINMPLYLNEDGVLSVAVMVATPAGAGAYWVALPIARDVSEWENLKKVDLPEAYTAGNFNKILLGLYGESGFDAQEYGDGSIYYFGFDSADAGVFVFQKYEPNGDMQNYRGTLTLTGMDTDGYLFEFEFATNNGRPVSENDLHSGSFHMRRYYEYEPDDYYEEYAVYRWIDGDYLFGEGVKEQRMRPAFG